MNRTIQMLLVMFGSLSTVAASDIFLPSLPSIAVYFSASEDMTQLSIPIFLISSVIGAPLLGILSDKFGRRPVMLSGLTLFLFGTILCAFAPNLPFFLTARLFQGFGAVVSPVVGWAIIQDLYKREEGARIMSWMGAVISIGPFVAPGLGGYIHVAFGWQGNFIFIFLFSALILILMILFKPQLTMPLRSEKVFSRSTLIVYGRILKDIPFVCYISLFGILTCGQWCFLTVIPFYFENTLGLSPDVFGLYISGSSSAFIIGTLITPSLLKKIGAEKTMILGAILPLLGTTFLLLSSALLTPSPLLITVSFGTYCLGTAIIWGPSTSRALQLFPDIRGSSSAVRSIIISGSFAIGGLSGSLMNDSSIFPLSFFLLAMAILCWIVLKKVLSYKT